MPETHTREKKKSYHSVESFLSIGRHSTESSDDLPGAILGWNNTLIRASATRKSVKVALDDNGGVCELAIRATNTLDGILLYDVTHLISAARTITARQVTLDPSWIIERLNDIESVLEDLNLFSENDEEVLQLSTRATPLPIPVIEKDPRQIIGRLVGRLKAATIAGQMGNTAVKEEIQDFVRKLNSPGYGFKW